MRLHRSLAEIERRAAEIRLLVLDVDGVLTDGGLIFQDDGQESKVFHVRDGHGIRLLQRGGIEVALLTGRSSQVVARRARELGVELVAQGSKNKLLTYQEILQQRGLRDQEVAYVGDDLVDIPVLKRVGLAVAVADAAAPLHGCCHATTRSSGGRGAVREVCEYLLKAQNKWEEVTCQYLGEDSMPA